jgi:phosphoribosylglycinamide formyltransferase-1
MRESSTLTKIKTVILCSGSGSNMEHIAKACISNDLPLEIEFIVTNNENALCLERAKNLGLKSHVLPKGQIPRDSDLHQLLINNQIQLILLAGYLKKIPDIVINEYTNRILNIHPALLPKFGGAGMYGIKVHQAVHQAQEKTSGATVHIVTEEFDKGPIILQDSIAVEPSDSPEEIAKKVLTIEHTLYVRAIKKYLTLNYI